MVAAGKEIESRCEETDSRRDFIDPEHFLDKNVSSSGHQRLPFPKKETPLSRKCSASIKSLRVSVFSHRDYIGYSLPI